MWKPALGPVLFGGGVGTCAHQHWATKLGVGGNQNAWATVIKGMSAYSSRNARGNKSPVPKWVGRWAGRKGRGHVQIAERQQKVEGKVVIRSPGEGVWEGNKVGKWGRREE